MENCFSPLFWGGLESRAHGNRNLSRLENEMVFPRDDYVRVLAEKVERHIGNLIFHAAEGAGSAVAGST